MENKVLGFMTLYYGKPYLREALLSIRDHVDKMHIAYTGKASHGIYSTEKCPDTEIELHNIAHEVLGDKLIWDPKRDGYPSESAHRDRRYAHSEGYEIILTIDSDEIMVGIPQAIEYARSGKAQYYGIHAYGYVNFFRSFNWICRDAFCPIRLENLAYKNGIQDHGCPMVVYHFSTALPEKYMRFKYKIFGHATEVKKNYLEDIFYKWSPEKIEEVVWVHPTSITIWHHPEPFDKSVLPDYLKQHPDFNLESI